MGCLFTCLSVSLFVFCSYMNIHCTLKNSVLNSKHFVFINAVINTNYNGHFESSFYFFIFFILAFEKHYARVETLIYKLVFAFIHVLLVGKFETAYSRFS